MTLAERQEEIAVRLRNMNIAAVARETGLQSNTLLNIKNRKGRRANPATLALLAQYLGVKG